MTDVSTQVRRFVGAVGMLTGPNLLGALLSLLITPWLVLWFSPKDFGDLAAALASGAIVSNLLTLRLEVLLYQTAEDELRSAGIQSVIIAAASAAAALLIYLPAAGLVHGQDATQSTLQSVLVIGLGLALGLINIGTVYRITARQYLANGASKILSPLVILSVGAASALGHYGLPFPLLFAHCLGLGSAGYILCRPLFARPTYAAIHRACTHVRTNLRYISVSVPQAMISSAGLLNAFLLVVGGTYGAAQAGQLFLAVRIIGFPSSLLSSATSNLIAAEAGRRGTNAPLHLFGIAILVFGVGLYSPIAVALTLVPDHWIPLNWVGAIDFAYPVVLLCFAQFVMGSFAQLLMIWDRGRQLLVWDAGRTSVTTSIAYLGYLYGVRILVAIWIFAVLQTAAYVIMILLVWSRARQMAATEIAGASGPRLSISNKAEGSQSRWNKT